jgi:hypothetical protein
MRVTFPYHIFANQDFKVVGADWARWPGTREFSFTERSVVSRPEPRRLLRPSSSGRGSLSLRLEAGIARQRVG